MKTRRQSPLMRDLNEHLQICRKVLAVVERESEVLRETSPDLQQPYLERKSLLPALEKSMSLLRNHRVEWGRRTPQERAGEPGIAALLRETQDLIMRIIVADRENEQALLRMGLVPPRHLPPANAQRPQDVAGMYRHLNPSQTACPKGTGNGD